MIGSRSVYGKTPMRQLHSYPIAVSGSSTQESNQFIRRCIYAGKCAAQVVLSRMQLTLHAARRTPHGVSRLVLATSVWSVRARRAPFRHCRDDRFYGQTTTTMHDDECPPPPSLFFGQGKGGRKELFMRLLLVAARYTREYV